MKLTPESVDAQCIIDKDGDRILEYIVKTFDDTDFTDKDYNGRSLYEVIVIPEDLEMLAKHIFDEGNGYYQMVVADEPNYFIDYFKDIIFNN